MTLQQVAILVEEHLLDGRFLAPMRTPAISLGCLSCRLRIRFPVTREGRAVWPISRATATRRAAHAYAVAESALWDGQVSRVHEKPPHRSLPESPYS